MEVTDRVDGSLDRFELAVLAPIVCVATVGSAGLLLAVLGAYRTWLALLIGLPLAAVALALTGRPQPLRDRASRVGAGAAAVLAIAFFVFAAATPSQHVVLDRDPASYTNTARWLVREGTLELDAAEGGFEDLPGPVYSSAAVYDMGGGDVEFQFNHFASVPLAVAYDLGGYRLMFRVPALMSALGLLVVYAATVRATRRPLLSTVAPALLAVGMPLLYVARDTYSEPYTLAFLWAAMVVAASLHRVPRAAVGALGGVLFGALVATRADALVYVALLFPLIALSVVVPAESRVRRRRVVAWGAFVAAAVPPAAIGLVDLYTRSGRYVTDISDQMELGRLAVLASAVVSVLGAVVWLRWSTLRSSLVGLHTRLARPLAVGAVVALVGGLLLGWLVRPAVQTATSEVVYGTVQTIQERDGLEVIPNRNYAEQTMVWMTWYLGLPTFVAALGGLAVAAWRVVRARIDPMLVGAFALGVPTAVLYWWDPTITPDQPWASRRFVPAVLPVLALMVVVALAALAAALLPRLAARRAPDWVLPALGAVSVAALLIPPALSVLPLRWQRQQSGYLQPVQEVCDRIGERAAVVVVGGFAEVTLPQAVRSWCGVPAVAAGSLFESSSLPEVADLLDERGRDLYLLGVDESGPRSVEGATELPGEWTSSMVDRWTLEKTLDRLPDRFVDPHAVLPTGRPFSLFLIDASGARIGA
jgi:hypothetical protein